MVRVGWICVGLMMVLAHVASAGEVHVVTVEPNGLVVEVTSDELSRRMVNVNGQRFDQVNVPGWPLLFRPHAPAVPVKGVLIGVPFGAQMDITVLSADYEEWTDVDLIPVSETQWMGSDDYPVPRENYRKDMHVYGVDAFYPGEEAVITQTGNLRDQRVAALSLRPVQYNPVRRMLRVAKQLRVRITFVSGASRPALKPSNEGEDGPFEPVYQQGLLNADQARVWRGQSLMGLGKQTLPWLDPLARYYKVAIREDGLYRLNADWFSASKIGLGTGDLDRLKVFVDGSEIPLLIEDGGDGRLDSGDGVFFWGIYRRAPDRDFDSEYGRDRLYWLTVDGGEGLRYVAEDGSVRRNFPGVSTFQSQIHAEIDSTFEALGFAPDVDRDHWFWKRTASPSRIGDAATPVVMPLPLPGLAHDAGGEAHIQLGMHALTLSDSIAPDHHTVVRIENGPVIAENRWDGQTAFVASGTVPVSALADTTRFELSTPGDPSFPLTPVPYIDHVFFNWITVLYPRTFDAVNGHLAFQIQNVGEGRTATVSKLRSDSVRILSPQLGKVITGGAVSPNGSGVQVRFELAQNGHYVVADAGAIRVPDLAALDGPSNLRQVQSGAHYVIVTSAEFRTEADRLAAHRQSQGLSVRVVDAVDIYDEFSFGQTDAHAIRHFVQYAYQTWTERPAYVLLFGRFSFDYRDKFGEVKSSRKNYIPSLPFQSIRRGLAFTDEYYGRVDDDLFMDVFVGRFSVNWPAQANSVTQKVIDYDGALPEPWRDRILLMANWDDINPKVFTDSSDVLGSIAETAGLDVFKVYHDENTPPEPNESSRDVIRQINDGRLIVNFMGHGSSASMSRFFAGTFQQTGFNYMSQIVNGHRLPLFIGMSCLNGLYWDPRVVCLAEEMVNKPDGGAVAYISASSLAFIGINNHINLAMFRHAFEAGNLTFGQMLALAKIEVLAQNPGIEPGVIMMNLIGDPAQKLAVPTSPDFEISTLALNQMENLTTSDSVRIHVGIHNWGILPNRSVDVVVLDRNLDFGQTDTLFAAAFLPFGQLENFTLLWHLAGKAGRHVIEVEVDPNQKIAEGNENNNRQTIDVSVFGALSAVLTVPLNSQVVAPSTVRLGVRSGTGERSLVAEYEVHTTPDFQSPGVIRSGQVAGADGMVLWRPVGLSAGTYFWRVRLTDGQAVGPWSLSQSFVVAEAPPDRAVVWQQNGDTAFRQGVPENMALFDNGSAGRVQSPPPMLFAEFKNSFEAQQVAATAVLCSDGTYLYVKRFYSPDSLYPGTDIFERIGTGLNGTVAGQYYGRLTDVPIAGISATYHSDGFVYAEHQKAFSVLRIWPATGKVDTVSVPGGLLDLSRGLTFDDHALITSDGKFVYNVSSGINGVRRAGWSVRVFDPKNNWQLVREFAVEPTSTGFSYLFTDGVIADGRFLYLIEYGTGLTHRVRVVDATTGAFVTEFESDQAKTDILNGQYDWVNNKVWLGQLKGPKVYRYDGFKLPEFGSLTSDAIGPASVWSSLSLFLSRPERAEVDVLAESAPGIFSVLPDWQNITALPTLDLTKLGQVNRIQLRLRLYGEGLNPSPGLKTWSVRYTPLSDIGLTQLKAEPREVNALVPVRLTVDVLNRGPLDQVLATSVAFYSGPPSVGRLIGRLAIPENTPIGQVRPMLLVWQTAQFAGQHVVSAQLENFQGKPIFAGQLAIDSAPVVIVPSNDRLAPEIDIVAQDALGQVRPDDYLPSQPTFRIIIRDSAGVDLKTVRFALSGSGDVQQGDYDSGRITDRLVTPTSLSFVYTPAPLLDDRYVLSIQASDKLNNGPAKKTVAFQVSSELAIDQVLVSPNPISQTGAFTFVLSRPADVTVRIFTLSGRLVQVLKDPFARAGYNQIFWNGQDGGGYVLANGVYLYTIVADDGQGEVRVKEKLIVYR